MRKITRFCCWSGDAVSGYIETPTQTIYTEDTGEDLLTQFKHLEKQYARVLVDVYIHKDDLMDNIDALANSV
jgi:hypothetical protein